MAARNKHEQGEAQERRAFAVASVGRGWWYWVVWPSLAQVRDNHEGDLVVDGLAPSKLEAIDLALASAGDSAHWLANSIARSYYKTRAQGSTSSIVKQEFLYHDVRISNEEGQKRWYSMPYLIVKRTPKYIYIAASPDQAAGQTDYWADASDARIRLDRAMLESTGYAFVSFADSNLYGLEEPLFYTTPFNMRSIGLSEAGDCFTLLGLTPPYSMAAVKQAYRRLAKERHPDRGGAADAFLALQMAYREALEALEG